jgi:hypothetical protein
MATTRNADLTRRDKYIAIGTHSRRSPLDETISPVIFTVSSNPLEMAGLTMADETFFHY